MAASGVQWPFPLAHMQRRSHGLHGQHHQRCSDIGISTRRHGEPEFMNEWDLQFRAAGRSGRPVRGIDVDTERAQAASGYCFRRAFSRSCQQGGPVWRLVCLFQPSLARLSASMKNIWNSWKVRLMIARGCSFSCRTAALLREMAIWQLDCRTCPCMRHAWSLSFGEL